MTHAIDLPAHPSPLCVLSTEIEQKRNISNLFLSSQGEEAAKQQSRLPTSALRVSGKPRTIFVGSTGKLNLTFSWCHSRALAFGVRCLSALANPVLTAPARLTCKKSTLSIHKIDTEVMEQLLPLCLLRKHPQGSSLRSVRSFSAHNTKKCAN